MVKTLQIPVAELMSRDLLIVHPDDTLERVGDILEANQIHHLPVVESNGKLVGLVSKSDFLRVNHMFALFDREKYGNYNHRLHKSVRVREVMTSHLATLAPDDPLSVAVGIFRENLFHALPVVDRGTLVGLLTTFDVINYCCSEELYLQP